MSKLGSIIYYYEETTIVKGEKNVNRDKCYVVCLHVVSMLVNNTSWNCELWHA